MISHKVLHGLNDLDSLGRQVTVSVVSHGQEAMLMHLLDDLARHASKSVRRVVVTHNLSSDGLLWREGAAEYFYHQIYNKNPKGFGANHNSAFCHCDTEWFAVINPDIRFESDVFKELIAQAMPDDVALGPALFDPERNKVAPNRGFLTIFEIIERRFIKQGPVENIVWLPGAFLLIRTEAFRRVGGFDERFFLYAEDFDLSARLKLAGGELRFVSDVQVTHAAQRSSHVKWRYLRWHAVSLMRLWATPSFWKYRALLQTQAARRADQRLR
ncbi:MULTISPECIES: glycosyltransferase family 2 protein [unclassified Thiomonas]|uniref:glycosyltransferase family 2 protein n=1 Tax=unclassified Thiomonas TaxID=2625466 RepID=UPI0012DEDB95|nr:MULTISPECIES: glycosyltransferase family 2 protein [unclassified Thiomonas]